MSISYTDLPLSTFPETLSPWIDRQDIQATDKDLMVQYQNYIKVGNMASAQDIINNNPSLKYKTFSAYNINELGQDIQAIKRMWNTNIFGYIQTKQAEMTTYVNGKETTLTDYVNTTTSTFDVKLSNFSDKGLYDNGTTYKQWNTVNYNFETYMSLQDNNLNHAPDLNLTYWRKIAQRGQQGQAGVGLSYIGAYNNTFSYSVGNAITYSNSIYYCINSSIGNIPTNTTYWQLFLANSGIAIQSTAPITPYSNMIWIDNSTTQNLMKYWTGTVWSQVSTYNASNITISDIGNIITATNVEDALQEIENEVITNTNSIVTNANKIAILNGTGAIVEKASKSALDITNTIVTNLSTSLTSSLADMSSQASGKGASLIGLNDSANKFTSTNVEGAMLELFTSANDGDAVIKTAIIGKGSTVLDANGDGIYTRQELANGINSIQQGHGTAIASDLLLGKTASSDIGDITGTLVAGKKQASGTTASNGSGILTITGLTFTPSYVMAWASSNFGAYGVFDARVSTTTNLKVAGTVASVMTGASASLGGCVLKPVAGSSTCYWVANE